MKVSSLCLVLFLTFVIACSAFAANDAQFINQSVPSSMVAGQVYSVSVTMKNTGTSTWTAVDNYRLGSQNPQDNGNWGAGRVYLSVGESIPPGQSKTFSFNVVPNSFGAVNFQWRMLREGVEWFGDHSPNIEVMVNENNSGRVIVNGKNFYLNGNKWFAYGANYFTSEGGNVVDSPYYENNLSQIEADLSKMQSLGFNAVWILMNPNTADSDANLKDFVARVARHNMKVSIAVANCVHRYPGHRYRCENDFKRLHDLGLTEDDTIFAYDLGWEVAFGYDRGWANREWSRWIVSNYGSVASAEAIWGVSLDKDYQMDNDAMIISHNIPSRMITGNVYDVQVTVKNVGKNSWSESVFYRLSLFRDASLFTSARVYLSGSEIVLPGQSKGFDFQMTAPDSAGEYTVGLMMIKEYVESFGEEFSQEITVASSGESFQAMETYAGEYAQGPTNAQLSADGSHDKMVTAYRHFVDDYTNKEYGEEIKIARKYDSKHLITAKMTGSNAVQQGSGAWFHYDLRTSTQYFDYITYELWFYTRFGLDQLSKSPVMSFYGDTGKPMAIGEFGRCGCYSGANCSGCIDSLDMTAYDLEIQKTYYSAAYDAMIAAGIKSSALWWFKGVRPGEKSDYGIVQDNANNDDKPVTSVIRNYAESMKNVSDKVPDYWITVDRDAHSDDWPIYQQGMDAYAYASSNGKILGINTTCTGKTSRDDMRLDAYLPKCLNSLFDTLQIKNAYGNWVSVDDSDVVPVARNVPIYTRALVSNLGEAKWLSVHSTGGGLGTVRLGGNENCGMNFRADISNNVSWQGSYDFGTVEFSDGINESKNITFQMVSEGVTWFGEKVDLELVPITVTTTTTTTTTTTAPSTTTPTMTSSTTTTTSTTTTSTTTPQCIMPANYPPCDEVSLSEVVDVINQWALDNLELGNVIDLINSWANPLLYPPN
jgi:hypothetical protein